MECARSLPGQSTLPVFPPAEISTARTRASHSHPAARQFPSPAECCPPIRLSESPRTKRLRLPHAPQSGSADIWDPLFVRVAVTKLPPQSVARPHRRTILKNSKSSFPSRYSNSACSRALCKRASRQRLPRVLRRARGPRNSEARVESVADPLKHIDLHHTDSVLPPKDRGLVLNPRDPEPESSR